MIQTWWRGMLAVCGVFVFVAGVYLAGYVASGAGTRQAIRSAEAAAASSAAEKRQLSNLAAAEKGIQTLLTQQHELSESNTKLLNGQVAADKAKLDTDARIIAQEEAAILKLAKQVEQLGGNPGQISITG